MGREQDRLVVHANFAVRLGVGMRGFLDRIIDLLTKLGRLTSQKLTEGRLNVLAELRERLGRFELVRDVEPLDCHVAEASGFEGAFQNRGVGKP